MVDNLEKNSVLNLKKKIESGEISIQQLSNEELEDMLIFYKEYIYKKKEELLKYRKKLNSSKKNI